MWRREGSLSEAGAGFQKETIRSFLPVLVYLQQVTKRMKEVLKTPTLHALDFKEEDGTGPVNGTWERGDGRGEKTRRTPLWTGTDHGVESLTPIRAWEKSQTEWVVVVIYKVLWIKIETVWGRDFETHRGWTVLQNIRNSSGHRRHLCTLTSTPHSEYCRITRTSPVFGVNLSVSLSPFISSLKRVNKPPQDDSSPYFLPRR